MYRKLTASVLYFMLTFYLPNTQTAVAQDQSKQIPKERLMWN